MVIGQFALHSLHCRLCEPLIAWVNDSSHDFWWRDSRHVLKRWYEDSNGVTFFIEWLDSSQSHFYKISKHVTDKPSYFVRKETNICASVMINIIANFLIWLSPSGLILGLNARSSSERQHNGKPVCVKSIGSNWSLSVGEESSKIFKQFRPSVKVLHLLYVKTTFTFFRNWLMSTDATSSGVNLGQGGTSAPGRSTLGAPKGVRKGLGLNPLLTLTFYKNFITCAKRINCFSHTFCLLLCRLNANTTE